MAAAKGSRRRAKPPLEYSILYTATLCLLAAGAVMVYSASSAEAWGGEAASQATTRARGEASRSASAAATPERASPTTR